MAALLGAATTVTTNAVTDDEASHGTRFVDASRQWFDSVWSTIAYDG